MKNTASRKFVNNFFKRRGRREKVIYTSYARKTLPKASLWTAIIGMDIDCVTLRTLRALRLNDSCFLLYKLVKPIVDRPKAGALRQDSARFYAEILLEY